MPKINNYFKKRREELMIEDPHCYWCGILVVYYQLRPHETMPDDFATIDHLYSRLTNKRHDVYGQEKTLVLACHKCNHERNHKEMKQQQPEVLWRRSNSYPLRTRPLQYFIIKTFRLPLPSRKKRRQVDWKTKQLLKVSYWLLHV